MRKRIQQLLVLALLLLAQVASAQITGVVIGSDDGEPLPGVSVVVKGTTNGVFTESDGSYSIRANQGDALVFSFMGMLTQEVKASGKEVNVTMSPEAQLIDEVMVVAYGTSTRKSFTGSASTVKGQDIAKLQSGNITKALEGAAAGVQYASSSGQPGSGASIRIRGIGSISAGTSPLYVVDGMPFEGAISSINPSDIESMTVLKDAAANSLYGSRASNGVILITTKRGQSGKARVSVEARVGVNQRAVPSYDMMDSPAMFYEMTWEAMRNDQYYRLGYSWSEAAMYANKYLIQNLGGYNNYNVPDNQIIDPATGKVYSSAKLLYHEDWSDEMFNQGTRQEYTASISGADEKTSYFMSFGYLNDEGYVVNSDFTRYSTRLKLDREVTKWMKIGANMFYVKTGTNTTSENSTAGSNMFYTAQIMSPIYPVHLYDQTTKQAVYDTNGTMRYDFGDAEGYARPVGSMTNPVASQSLDKQNSDLQSFNGKFFVDFKVKDFKFSVTYSVDAGNNLGLTYLNGKYGQYKNEGGISARAGQRNVTQVANELLTWAKEFDKHSVDVLVGHESYENVFNYWSAQKQNFWDPNQVELVGAIKNPQASSYETAYALESYISRAQYNYSGKYYLTASLRRDGSSLFYKDNRWGNFWSVGASWRLKQETFLLGVTWLDELKLKASYGTQGNDNLGIGGVTPWADQYTVGVNGDQFALVRSYLGNKDITWEKSGTFNIGFDYGFFNRRLTGSIEYFYKKTSDMLFSRPQAPSLGDASYPDNIGDMVNKGVEFDLSGVLIRGNDLLWTVSFNATHFSNVIKKLPPENASGIASGRFKLVEGKSIYEYYIKEYAGVASDGQAQWYRDVTDANGNVIDVTTTTDYSQATDYFQGSAIPIFNGGIGTSFNFKGIDFSVQTSYQVGGKGYDAVYASTMSGSSYGFNMHKDLLKRWTPTYTETDIPRLQIGENTDGSRTSSRFFVSSAYFNIRNITLGYTLPKVWMKKVNMESARIYAVVDNVVLFSARRGYDPRTSWSGASAAGLYAPIRTMSLGFSLSF